LDLNLISDKDKAILLTLSDNSVPFEWRKMWQGPQVATDFLKSVIIRIQTALKYLSNIDAEIEEIDFSKIFNVDSFLSTVKLVTSRVLKISTSNLMMDSFVDVSQYERIKSKKNKVIKVAPLIIDGLAYYENKLVISDGYNSNLSSMTNNIYIYFKEEFNDKLANENNTYDVPLYSNYSREKMLCTIKMNSSLNENDLIYSGTALIVPMT
jgi:hypothetical protein